MATFKPTPVTRVLKGVVVVGLILGAVWGASNFLPGGGLASFVPESGELAAFSEANLASEAPVGEVSIPASADAVTSGPTIRLEVIPWNSQMGLLFSNGGASTKQGSLMEKYGVSLNVSRQDDYGQMKNNLVAFATELAGGNPEPANGSHFVTIMGDGAPYFLASLNGMLEKLGPDYQAEIIGGFGRSFGEDQFMGPPECVKDPKACKGKRIAGVLLDGDWNLAMFWAAQNNICVNSDVKTYDPECLNWYGTSSFVEADEAYIRGTCEDLPVVSNGKKVLGGKQNVCISGVVTWTPGDVAVTEQKGGIASLLTTRENSSQMPNVVIGIRKWNAANASRVTNFLRAGLEGGAAVKADSAALLKGGAVSAEVYKEGDAGYWVTYYKGTEKLDKTGTIMVKLGGSRVFGIADAFRFFGLETGAVDAFEATYTYFGNLGVQAYPTEMPSFPAHATIFNSTYLKALKADNTVVAGEVEAPVFSSAPATSTAVAARTWAIQFRTGSAEFSDTAALRELLTVLAIADNTVVEIHGHTDNVGNPASNMQLSEDRAFAVKSWLAAEAAKTFPADRIKTHAHGQESPIASNSTRAGQAQNRRVEIVIKSN